MAIQATQLYAELKLGVSTETIPSDLKKTLDNLIEYSRSTGGEVLPECSHRCKGTCRSLIEWIFIRIPKWKGCQE